MQRALWLFALVLFVLAVGGFWGLAIWQDREATLAEAGQRTATTARLLEENAVGVLEAGEKLLGHMAVMAQRWNLQDSAVAGAVFEDMRRMVRSTPQISAVWMLDRDGTSVFDTWSYPTEGRNYAYREYFRAHAEGVDGLYVGPTETGAKVGQRRFTLSRRLVDPGGRFSGVVAAGVYTEYFAELYRDVAPGEEGAIALFTISGHRLATWPREAPEGVFGPAMQQATQGPAQGLVRLDGPRGGRIVAYRRLPEHPVVVLASQPLADALADWRRRATLSGVVGLVVLAGFLLLTLRALRAARSEHEALDQLADSHRLLEARVQARTAELEALYRDAPVGLALISPDLRIMKVNERLASYSRYAPPQQIGRPLQEVVPAMNPPVEPVLERVLSTGEPVLGLESRGGNGGEIVWRSDLYPVKDRGGRVVAVGAVVQNISDEARVQAALRTSEERLRVAVENAPLVLANCDRDLHYTWVARPHPGFGGDALLGRRDDEVFPADQAQYLLRKKRCVLTTGRGERGEIGVDTPWGRRWWDVVLEPLRGPDGGIEGLTLAALDVTQRKNAEMALLAREGELRMVADAIPALVSHIGPDLRYRFANQRYVEWFGRPRKEILGRHMAEVIGERAYEAVRDKVAAALRGEAVQFDAALPFKHGGPRHVSAHYIPRIAQDGRPDGFYIYASDITEQKAAEERQALLMAELDHRVRNILASIQSMASLTGLSAANKEEYARALEGRIAAMARTHGLLTRTRWRGASLERLLRDELEPYAKEGEAVLLDGEVDCMLGPKEAVNFALVVHELATNAAKYGALSAPGGRVRVTWRVEPGDGNSLLRLEWREEGGPPVEPPKRRGFGSRLVETALAGNDGASVALSFPPEGVRCAITMPLRRLMNSCAPEPADPTPAPGVVRPSAGTPLRGIRALLVEDEMLVGMEMRRVLTDAGAEVLGPALTLRHATDLAQDEAPDIGVLDVNLNGEMVDGLADLLVSRGVPFVFVTGYDTCTALPSRLRGVPALQKPVDAAALIAALREQLTASATA